MINRCTTANQCYVIRKYVLLLFHNNVLISGFRTSGLFLSMSHLQLSVFRFCLHSILNVKLHNYIYCVMYSVMLSSLKRCGKNLSFIHIRPFFQLRRRSSTSPTVCLCVCLSEFQSEILHCNKSFNPGSKFIGAMAPQNKGAFFRDTLNILTTQISAPCSLKIKIKLILSQPWIALCVFVDKVLI